MENLLGHSLPVTETEAQARARLGKPRRVVAGHNPSLDFARQHYPHPEDALFHEGTHVRPLNWAWTLLAAGLFIFALCFALEATR